MPNRVHKFPILLADEFTIDMPKFAKIIRVGAPIYDKPFMWAIVDTNMPDERRTFYVRGTGYDLPEKDPLDPSELVYIGTFEMALGNLIFHVFEFQLDSEEK